jgi:hypothetical protein
MGTRLSLTRGPATSHSVQMPWPSGKPPPLSRAALSHQGSDRAIGGR